MILTNILPRLFGGFQVARYCHRRPICQLSGPSSDFCLVTFLKSAHGVVDPQGFKMEILNKTLVFNTNQRYSHQRLFFLLFFSVLLQKGSKMGVDPSETKRKQIRMTRTQGFMYFFGTRTQVPALSFWGVDST